MPTRRQFVKRTSAATATAAFASPLGLWAATPSTLSTVNIGVIGAGGRGTGAVNDCLTANDHVNLVAIADLSPEICKRARDNLADHGDRVQVPDSNIFAGLDAYKEVIHHPDVHLVILTTSPGFRATHLAEAVRARKHAFVEKPVCLDATAYRSCLASGEIARSNGTAIVSGTQYRRQPSYREAIQRIHDGMIGEVLSGTSYYCSAGIWYRERQPGMTDLEYQLRNWYHFVWLCGDQIAEQAVHNLDAVNWAMGSPPETVYGSGGQMTRPADSEIYDHMSLDYIYPSGANISFKCRQIPGSTSRVINTFVGTKGVAYVNPGGSRIMSHGGQLLYIHEGRGNNPYQQEHADLIASIRAGTPIMEIQDVADSSLTAVMGRMAAYSGHDVTWDFAQNSQLDMMPKNLTMETEVVSPGVAVPGEWELV